MIDTTLYTVDDIEEFISITKLSSTDKQSKSLKKLISVQDKISIFKDIDPNELRAIIHNLQFVKYSFNDNIIKQNERSSEIYYIITGNCKVFYHAKEVGILKAGDVFGEAGAIFDMKRNATVTCASHDVTLLSFNIDHNNMEFCSTTLATLYKNLAFEINAKLKELNQIYTMPG